MRTTLHLFDRFSSDYIWGYKYRIYNYNYILTQKIYVKLSKILHTSLQNVLKVKLLLSNKLKNSFPYININPRNILIFLILILTQEENHKVRLKKLKGHPVICCHLDLKKWWQVFCSNANSQNKTCWLQQKRLTWTCQYLVKCRLYAHI